MSLPLEEITAPRRCLINVFGTSGSGKTLAAAAISAGWCLANGHAGIYVWDAESAWGWVAPAITAMGVKIKRYDASLDHASDRPWHRRSMSNVKEFTAMARTANAVAAFDGMTQMVQACEQEFLANPKRKKKYLEPTDYGRARQPFKEWAESLPTMGLPVVATSRHGLEYGVVVDDDGNKKDAPIGHKAKAGDAQYEFDFTIECECVRGKKKSDAEVTTLYKMHVDKARGGLANGIPGWTFRATQDEAAAIRAVCEAFAPLFARLKGGE